MEKPSEQLYVEYIDGKPAYYAYGEEWVAQALYMGDMRYPTQEKAKEAWKEYKAQEKEKSELIQHVEYTPEQMGYDK